MGHQLFHCTNSFGQQSKYRPTEKKSLDEKIIYSLPKKIQQQPRDCCFFRFSRCVTQTNFHTDKILYSSTIPRLHCATKQRTWATYFNPRPCRATGFLYSTLL